jgi:hypothetical protein
MRRIDLDLHIAFAETGSGFEDADVSLRVTAEYEGLNFIEPHWNDPASVRFPADWRIPTEYSEATVRELFERFVDTSEYMLVRRDTSYTLDPRIMP